MKPLNKNSKLYKLNMEYGIREFSQQSRHLNKVSLCTLVSSTISVILKGIVFLWMVLFLSTGGLMIVGSLLSPLFLISGWIPSFVDIIFLYPLLIAVLFITILFGSVMCHNGIIPFAPEYMKFRRKPTQSAKVKYSFRDSYVYQYFKSLKDKVCPIIDIVD